MLLCVYKSKTETGDNSMDRYLFNKFVFEPVKCANEANKLALTLENVSYLLNY